MSDDSPVRKRRLRNFLLDPGFQLKYAALIALTGGVVFGVMGGLFYAQVRVSTEIAALDRVARAPVAPTPTPGAEAAPPPVAPPAGLQVEAQPIEVVGDPVPPSAEPLPDDQGAFDAELADRLAEDDGRLRMKLVVSWVVLVTALFALGILATHRIVGPLYVVDRYLARIIAGEPVRFRPLRKGDEFQELFERVQELAAQLDRERAEDVRAIDDALRAIRAEARGADPEALAAALAPLEALAAERAVQLVEPGPRS